MKYCGNCGNPIDDYTLFCPSCGASQGQGARNDDSVYTNSNDYKGSKTLAVLAFFFPIVGLIIWLLKRYTSPGYANSAAKGALAGVCWNSPVLGIIFYFVWRESHRDFAKICLLSAIIGFVISLIFSTVFELFFADDFEAWYSEIMEDIFGDLSDDPTPDDGYNGPGIYLPVATDRLLA